MKNSLVVLIGMLLVFSSCSKDVTDGFQPCPGMPFVVDIDSNEYSAVQIGTQCWITSNLKVCRYRNGDSILTQLSNEQWSSTKSGAFAIFSNDEKNDSLYGKLYNWYAVSDSRGLCPAGWHVPTDNEWSALITHLGGESVAGGKMKSTDTQPLEGGWNSPNVGATNTSGFTGLPGGYRVSGGQYYDLRDFGNWWSSTSEGSNFAQGRYLHDNNKNSYRGQFGQNLGFSVRCVRD